MNRSPQDAAIAALTEYIHTAPLPEMLLAVEALRLIGERPNKAAALFAPETKSLPPTEKQVALLKQLGHSGKVSNREEASTEIQKWLGNRKQKTTSPKRNGANE